MNYLDKKIKESKDKLIKEITLAGVIAGGSAVLAGIVFEKELVQYAGLGFTLADLSTYLMYNYKKTIIPKPLYT